MESRPRSHLREFETRAQALKDEAKRCTAMAKAWEKRYVNLEAMVIDIMQVTKQTRIDGRHSVLTLKKNPPSVDVAQPDMVPVEYQRVTVTMKRSIWQRIRVALEIGAQFAGSQESRKETLSLALELPSECKVSEPEPEKRKIGEELKLGGSVPGCRLKTDGVRLEVK